MPCNHDGGHNRGIKNKDDREEILSGCDGWWLRGKLGDYGWEKNKGFMGREKAWTSNTIASDNQPGGRQATTSQNNKNKMN